MDKTVRLWHISYDECLRIFSHNDYGKVSVPLIDSLFCLGEVVFVYMSLFLFSFFNIGSNC